MFAVKANRPESRASIKQAEQVGKPSASAIRNATQFGRIVNFFRAGCRRSGFLATFGHRRRNRTGSSATAAAAGTRVTGDAGTATVDDFVTTRFQAFFRLTTDFLVAVTQSGGQRGHDLLAAAAGVLTKLVADFIRGFRPDFFVGIVQGVNHRNDDFRIALAIEVTQIVNRMTAIFGVAGGLRRVDQLGDFTGVGIAALRLAAGRLVAARRFAATRGFVAAVAFVAASGFLAAVAFVAAFALVAAVTSRRATFRRGRLAALRRSRFAALDRSRLAAWLRGVARLRAAIRFATRFGAAVRFAAGLGGAARVAARRLQG